MLFRVVLVVVLVLLAVRFVLLLMQIARKAARGPIGIGRARPIDLVRCRRCGVMVPGFRALPDGPDAYVCRTCAGR